MASTTRLFLFVLMARQPGSDRAPGPQPVLAFASAVNVDDAIDLADLNLKAAGWAEMELQAAKELSTDLDLEPDPVARAAMSQALSEGASHLTY